MLEPIDIKKNFELTFTEFKNTSDKKEADLVCEFREKAFKEFLETEFPTVKNEEWKYTNITPLFKFKYKTPAYSDFAREAFEKIADTLKINESKNFLVFINGKFNQGLSSVSEKEKFRYCGSLKELLYSEEELKKDYLTLNVAKTAFTLMNDAFISDGAFISTKDNAIVENPVELIFINTNNITENLISVRNIIETGKNSNLEITETYFGEKESVYFCNAVTRILLKDNSVCKKTKIIEESQAAFHIGLSSIEQKSHSAYTDHSISLNGKIIRNDLINAFKGSGSECNLHGLYIAENEQLIDNHTSIDHAVPHCNSNQTYKGVLKDNSRAVFNGKVLVRKDSQKTNAYQSNKNMLLSKESVVNTKPQLEIFADDVKCSHGATVGQLDEEALFYLQARGISKSSAYMMLVGAFINEVIDEVSNESIKNNIERSVIQKTINFSI